MNKKLQAAFEIIINDGRLFKHTDQALAVEALEEVPDVDGLTVSIFGNIKSPTDESKAKLTKILKSLEDQTGYKPSLILGTKIGFEKSIGRAFGKDYEVMINPFTTKELTDTPISVATKSRDLRTLQLSNIAVFFVNGNGQVRNPAYSAAVQKGALVSVIRV